MKNVTKVLAKEIRRVRALVELMEKYGVAECLISPRIIELESLKRILALMIKEKLDCWV